MTFLREAVWINGSNFNEANPRKSPKEVTLLSRVSQRDASSASYANHAVELKFHHVKLFSSRFERERASPFVALRAAWSATVFAFRAAFRVSVRTRVKSILSCADYVNRLDIARRVTSQRAIRTIEQDHGSQERLCSLIRVISDPLIDFALAERANNRFNNTARCSRPFTRAFRDSTARGETSSLRHLRPRRFQHYRTVRHLPAVVDVRESMWRESQDRGSHVRGGEKGRKHNAPVGFRGATERKSRPSRCRSCVGRIRHMRALRAAAAVALVVVLVGVLLDAIAMAAISSRDGERCVSILETRILTSTSLNDSRIIGPNQSARSRDRWLVVRSSLKESRISFLKSERKNFF